MPILSDKHFENDIKQGITVVKFYSLWDSSCRAFEDVFKQLAEEFKGRARFMESDINANPELAEDMGIRKVPTLIVFVNGKQIAKIENISSKRYLKEMFENYINKTERII